MLMKILCLSYLHKYKDSNSTTSICYSVDILKLGFIWFCFDCFAPCPDHSGSINKQHSLPPLLIKVLWGNTVPICSNYSLLFALTMSSWPKKQNSSHSRAHWKQPGLFENQALVKTHLGFLGGFVLFVFH